MKLLSVFLFTIYLNCNISPPTITKGSGSETVLGKVILQDGSPADEATVTLSQITITNTGDSLLFHDTTISDELGEFQFKDVPHGTCIVQCSTPSQKGIGSRLQIQENQAEIDPITLRQPVIIMGRIINSTGVTVQVPGTNLETTPDINGIYVLSTVAQGQLEILFIKDDIINYLPVKIETTQDTAYIEDLTFATSKTESNNDISLYQTKLQSFTVLPVNYSDTVPPLWYVGKDFGSVSYYSVSAQKETQEIALPLAGLKKIFIRTGSTGANISEDLEQFPLCIRLTQENFDFTQNSMTSDNISFIDSAGQILSHEIEYWDNTGKRALLWVLLPLVVGNNDSQYILMKWGAHPSMTGIVFNSSNNYRGVWHLDNTLSDATGNGNIGEDFSTTSATGILGPARDFERDNLSYISIPNESHFDISGLMTVSAWVKVESFREYWDPIVAKSGNSYRLHRNYNFDGASFSVTVPNDTLDAKGTTSFNDSTFHYLVGIRNADSISIYIDGNLDTSIAHNNLLTNLNDELLMIGRSNEFERYFDGIIDEVRVSDIDRNPAWIKLCFETQRENQTAVIVE